MTECAAIFARPSVAQGTQNNLFVFREGGEKKKAIDGCATAAAVVPGAPGRAMGCPAAGTPALGGCAGAADCEVEGLTLIGRCGCAGGSRAAFSMQRRSCSPVMFSQISRSALCAQSGMTLAITMAHAMPRMACPNTARGTLISCRMVLTPSLLVDAQKITQRVRNAFGEDGIAGCAFRALLRLFALAVYRRGCTRAHDVRNVSGKAPVEVRVF